MNISIEPSVSALHKVLSSPLATQLENIGTGVENIGTGVENIGKITNAIPNFDSAPTLAILHMFVSEKRTELLVMIQDIFNIYEIGLEEHDILIFFQVYIDYISISKQSDYMKCKLMNTPRTSSDLIGYISTYFNTEYTNSYFYRELYIIILEKYYTILGVNETQMEQIINKDKLGIMITEIINNLVPQIRIKYDENVHVKNILNLYYQLTLLDNQIQTFKYTHDDNYHVVKLIGGQTRRTLMSEGSPSTYLSQTWFISLVKSYLLSYVISSGKLQLQHTSSMPYDRSHTDEQTTDSIGDELFPNLVIYTRTIGNAEENLTIQHKYTRDSSFEYKYQDAMWMAKRKNTNNDYEMIHTNVAISNSIRRTNISMNTRTGTISKYLNMASSVMDILAPYSGIVAFEQITEIEKYTEDYDNWIGDFIVPVEATIELLNNTTGLFLYYDNTTYYYKNTSLSFDTENQLINSIPSRVKSGEFPENGLYHLYRDGYQTLLKYSKALRSLMEKNISDGILSFVTLGLSKYYSTLKTSRNFIAKYADQMFITGTSVPGNVFSFQTSKSLYMAVSTGLLYNQIVFPSLQVLELPVNHNCDCFINPAYFVENNNDSLLVNVHGNSNITDTILDDIPSQFKTDVRRLLFPSVNEIKLFQQQLLLYDDNITFISNIEKAINGGHLLWKYKYIRLFLECYLYKINCDLDMSSILNTKRLTTTDDFLTIQLMKCNISKQLNLILLNNAREDDMDGLLNYRNSTISTTDDTHSFDNTGSLGVLDLSGKFLKINISDSDKIIDGNGTTYSSIMQDTNGNYYIVNNDEKYSITTAFGGFVSLTNDGRYTDSTGSITTKLFCGSRPDANVLGKCEYKRAIYDNSGNCIDRGIYIKYDVWRDVSNMNKVFLIPRYYILVKPTAYTEECDATEPDVIMTGRKRMYLPTNATEDFYNETDTNITIRFSTIAYGYTNTSLIDSTWSVDISNNVICFVKDGRYIYPYNSSTKTGYYPGNNSPGILTTNNSTKKDTDKSIINLTATLTTNGSAFPAYLRVVGNNYCISRCYRNPDIRYVYLKDHPIDSVIVADDFYKIISNTTINPLVAMNNCYYTNIPNFISNNYTSIQSFWKARIIPRSMGGNKDYFDILTRYRFIKEKHKSYLLAWEDVNTARANIKTQLDAGITSASIYKSLCASLFSKLGLYKIAFADMDDEIEKMYNIVMSFKTNTNSTPSRIAFNSAFKIKYNQLKNTSGYPVNNTSYAGRDDISLAFSTIYMNYNSNAFPTDRDAQFISGYLDTSQRGIAYNKFNVIGQDIINRYKTIDRYNSTLQSFIERSYNETNSVVFITREACELIDRCCEILDNI